MTAKEVLRAAAALVRKGHTKERLACDAYGHEVTPLNSRAVAWCMEGAIRCAAGDPNTTALSGLSDAAWKAVVGLGPVNNILWNDAPERTAEEVALRLEEAARYAR